MVKPGGTGRPRLAISARLAPLPPNRSRNSALPSALPSPKVKTHLPGFTACGALLLATGLGADTLGAAALGGAAFDGTALAGTFGAAFSTGLSGLFFRAFRGAATGARFPPPGAERFGFAAI